MPGRIPAPRSLRMRAIVCFGALAVQMALAQAASAQPPPTPSFAGVPVDLYPKPGPHSCPSSDPQRPGMRAFADMVLAAYPSSSSGEIWAPCTSPAHIGLSHHHTGRAWDWFVVPKGTVAGPTERAAGDELVGWLLEPVEGQPHMRARRLGVVEIIWFDQLWTSGARQWVPYTFNGCPDPGASNTSCHRDHVHVTLSVEGAEGNTSWWRGLIGWVQSTLGALL